MTDLSLIRKFELVTEICWAVSIWIVKSSILAFYWRLFSVNRRSTRVIIWVLAVFITGWGLATVRPLPLRSGLWGCNPSEHYSQAFNNYLGAHDSIAMCSCQ